MRILTVIARHSLDVLDIGLFVASVRRMVVVCVRSVRGTRIFYQVRQRSVRVWMSGACFGFRKERTPRYGFLTPAPKDSMKLRLGQLREWIIEGCKRWNDSPLTPTLVCCMIVTGIWRLRCRVSGLRLSGLRGASFNRGLARFLVSFHGRR